MIYTFILFYALGNISGLFTALFFYLRMIDRKDNISAMEKLLRFLTKATKCLGLFRLSNYFGCMRIKKYPKEGEYVLNINRGREFKLDKEEEK